ncbi:MAG TPA: superoxide dismutase family protein [Longimicrobium sp.]
MRRAYALILPLAVCAWLAACGDEEEPITDRETAASAEFDSAAAAITPVDETVTDTIDTDADTAGRASATLRDAQGQELGTLALRQRGQGIVVEGRLSGLPEGQHGIHLHAVGRCDPPFESAGPHWNPTSRQHGTQNPQGPHAGDLPSLTATGDGIADVAGTTPAGRLSGAGGLLDADGAAIVVHEKADDNRTDPSGNSGARIACGVIQSAGAAGAGQPR